MMGFWSSFRKATTSLIIAAISMRTLQHLPPRMAWFMFGT